MKPFDAWVVVDKFDRASSGLLLSEDHADRKLSEQNKFGRLGPYRVIPVTISPKDKE